MNSQYCFRHQQGRLPASIWRIHYETTTPEQRKQCLSCGGKQMEHKMTCAGCNQQINDELYDCIKVLINRKYQPFHLRCYGDYIQNKDRVTCEDGNKKK